MHSIKFAFIGWHMERTLMSIAIAQFIYNSRKVDKDYYAAAITTTIRSKRLAKKLCLCIHLIYPNSLKDEPHIYFQARAWAKCLEILYPSLSTSIWLEVDKLQAWAQALKKIRASLRGSFLSSTVIVSLHFPLAYSMKKTTSRGFSFKKFKIFVIILAIKCLK